MTCEHDVAEQDTALADGLCPLCLVRDNNTMREALEMIAGSASDKLQAIQARCALDNIG